MVFGFKKNGKFRPTGNRKAKNTSEYLTKAEFKEYNDTYDKLKIKHGDRIEVGVHPRELGDDFFKKKVSKYKLRPEFKVHTVQGKLNNYSVITNRDKQSLEDFSSSEYAEQLKRLQDEFPAMMESIAKQKGCDYKDGKFVFKGTNTKMETVCGATTTKLFTKLPDLGLSYTSFKIEGGVYQGDGLLEGEHNRGHMWIRLDDGTIIDGSHGQFKDEVVDADDRLEIVTKDDPRQEDFVGLYESNPFTQEQTYYPDSTVKLKPLEEKLGKVVNI